MDTRLKQVFGPHLRVQSRNRRKIIGFTKRDVSPLTSDGRYLWMDAPSVRLAERLMYRGVGEYADEIIKLMKPFCYPFDVRAIRRQLVELGEVEDGFGSRKKEKNRVGVRKGNTESNVDDNSHS